MNYRHIYHAGNFADVFKHILLIALVRSLSRNEKSFCYLDSHAGIGSYDLQMDQAQKTQEYIQGIGKLCKLSSTTTLPQLTADYLHLVMEWNARCGGAELRYYPGSPVLVRKLLRPGDRMILAELHSTDVLVLKQQFVRDKQVAVHHTDAYQALKAFLPPKEGRGLVLIDPPFEAADEFVRIIQHLQLAVRRWAAGTYAVWYPIKAVGEIQSFYRDLQATGLRRMLRCEIHLPTLGSTSLSACGMLVVNPPWQWQEKIAALLPWLCDRLSMPYKGNCTVEWLVSE